MKQDFTYSGPATSFAFADEKGAILWEGAAHPGQELKGVPADHPHVKALEAVGHLSRASGSADVAEPVSDVGPSKASTKKGKEE